MNRVFAGKVPVLVLSAGLAWGLLAAIDPARPAGRIGGPLLALAGLGLARLRQRPLGPLVVPAVLAAALGLGAAAEPQFLRADFPAYYAYLRSLAFDGDLDFANEWRQWGLREMPVTPTGHRLNHQTIGAALLWAPFFAVAHAYVLVQNALGAGRYPADGFSAPYLRSALAGTVTAVVVGSFLLWRVLARRVSPASATLAVLGAVGTSPILFYAFVHPGMAHGLTFGIAAASVWAADRADRHPSARAWLLIGFLCGLAALVRLQAFVLGLLFIPFVVAGVRRRRLKPAWLLAAGAAGALAFSPQLLAWKAIYGRFFTHGVALEAWARQAGVSVLILFRPTQWLDPTAPFWREVLFSADRGFFNWTPGMLLAMVGLTLSLRRFGLLAAGGLLVFLGALWFNASLADITAGDSFGARRFDLVVPFAAVGYATALAYCGRRPLLAPALGLAALTLWNAGLIRLWLRYAFPGPAPLEELVQLQARQLRRGAEDVAGRLGGVRGRAAAYDTFVGTTLFFSHTEEVVDLADPRSSFLAGGWSEPLNPSGPPRYRAALFPRACVDLPLPAALGLPTTIIARAPHRLESQTMAVVFNDTVVGRFPLGPDWTDVAVVLPEDAARPGPNALCLEFTESIPSGEGAAIAAHVREIRIRSATSLFPNPAWNRRHRR